MSTLKLPVNSADHHQGNVNAAVTLIEYGDYECPYCGRAYPLIKRLLKERGDKLHFVFRNFPLRTTHPHAYMSAVAAEAAAKQDKFWEMHDLIFENQRRLSTNFLSSLAEKISVDLTQFDKDSKSEEIRNKIQTDFESGIRSGVNGTPAFFVTSSRLLTYDETYESLLAAVSLEAEM